MFRLVTLLGLITVPAFADVAEISECRISDLSNRTQIYCDVLNTSGTAVASIQFRIRILEEGRTVPWIKEGFDLPRLAIFRGGVEPSETRSLFFWHGFIPEEANMDRLTVDITPVQFLDVNGSPITPTE